MSIKDSYISTLDAIARRYGEAPPAVHIDPRASLQTTIGYTRRHVVEHDRPHFRYQYYHDALSLALDRLRFDSAERRVVHLDVGCGPGVFSWVIYDHIASQEMRDLNLVDYYGYDHCAAMIELAHLFLERFPDRYEFHGFSDLAEILTALVGEDFSNSDVVVTFGYALVQVRDNPAALGDFATLISFVFPAHSCIVVAADAHHDGSTRDAFDNQCGALETALNEVGVALEERVSPQIRSIMVARLTME